MPPDVQHRQVHCEAVLECHLLRLEGLQSTVDDGPVSFLNHRPSPKREIHTRMVTLGGAFMTIASMFTSSRNGGSEKGIGKRSKE